MIVMKHLNYHFVEQTKEMQNFLLDTVSDWQFQLYILF